MLCNEDPKIRAEAVDKIVALRNGSDFGDTSVCIFRALPLNLNAKRYVDLFNWNSNDHIVTKSILTCSLSITALNQIQTEKLVLPPFPSHTQSVERVIREITSAYSQVAGFHGRDGFICARYASRLILPKADTKKDFEAMVKMETD
jgi:hypothetical protein